MTFKLAFLLCGTLVSGVLLQMATPSINTSSGIYTCVVNNTAGIEFVKGVRYAQPPVGNLRFAAPVPTTSAPIGIQDGSNFGNACPQQSLSEAFTILYGSPSLAADISEDCLFLNIYRPEGTKSGHKLPVLVFLHGGAYSVGGSQFDGTSLVQRSVTNRAPIIFVTINYRLYITGFLGSTSVSPQDLNAGLSDQTLAFRFIQSNANGFGGDPSKVTIWGQSAGASSISLHCLYPSGDPLFRAAIQDSGTGTILNVPSAEQYDLPGKPFDTLMNITGCKGKSQPLACLRTIPIDDLLNFALVVDELTPQAAPGQSTTWVPSLGPVGSMITVLPSVKTQSGDYLRVPTITGTNKDEGTLFAINFLALTQSSAMDTVTFDTFVVNRTIDNTTIRTSSIQKFNELYPEEPPSPLSNSSLFDRLSRFVEDFHFVAPRRFETHHAAPSQHIWVYTFEEPIPGQLPYLGVFHGTELSFIGILNRTVLSAQAFSEQYMDFYLNFTVNLDPGFAWPKFTQKDRQILQFRNGNITPIADNFRLQDTTFINTPEINLEFDH